MEFFNQLSKIDDLDLTLRIMKDKNGHLTVNVQPGVRSLEVRPIIVTGSPEELDKDFFTEIMPVVTEVKGLIHNLAEVKDDVKQAVEKKSAAEKKKDAPKKATEKGNGKKQDKKKPVKAEPIPEPSLFDAGTQEEDRTSEEPNN